MRRPREKKRVDPHPVMHRGETPFEEKRIECEFELHFAKVAQLGLLSLKETHEYSFRQGYFTGKIAGKREQGESPEPKGNKIS